MFLLFNKSIIIFSIYKCLKNEPISYTKIMFLSPNLIRIIKIPLKNNKFDLVISFISILFAAALQMSIPYYLGSSIDKSLDASSSSELSLAPFIEIGLFTNNSLLIKYLFRLEDINYLILTPIQKNKFRLLINIVIHHCLNYINRYFMYNMYVEPLFKKNYLYLSYLEGMEELKNNIHDYVGFNTLKCQNIFNFVSLFSMLIMNSQISLQS